MGLMIHYQLDANKLRKILSQKGFYNLSHFTKANRLNRATLHHYLKGVGPFPKSYYKICEALQTDPLDLLAPTLAHQAIPQIHEITPLIKEISQYSPELSIGLFGSRAKKKAKLYSDWDLGVSQGDNPLSSRDYLRLKNKISDLSENLPRSIDLINLDQAPSWFLQEIDYKPVFLGGNKTNWGYFLGKLHAIQKNI